MFLSFLHFFFVFTSRVFVCIYTITQLSRSPYRFFFYFSRIFSPILYFPVPLLYFIFYNRWSNFLTYLQREGRFHGISFWSEYRAGVHAHVSAGAFLFLPVFSVFLQPDASAPPVRKDAVSLQSSVRRGDRSVYFCYRGCAVGVFSVHFLLGVCRGGSSSLPGEVLEASG